MNAPAKLAIIIRSAVLYTLAAAAICLFAAALYTVNGRTEDRVDVAAAPRPDPAGITEQAGSAVNAASAAEYILRSSGGVICVYTASGETVMRTQISVMSLREVDRNALLEGVRADTMEQVLSLLEDYGS